MTKAKTATKSAADAKKADDKAKGKKADPKNAKAAKPEKSDKKPAEKAKAARKPGKDTDRIVKQPAAPVETVVQNTMSGTSDSQLMRSMAFSNAGLGVKTSTKKPSLSVAPGVMILGRTAPVKPEHTPRPSERRLSKKEQQEIKSFLQARRERLLAGMRRELALQKERAESKAADEVDKATDAYDEDLSFEIATANDQELEEIQVALEKIEKGTYGECEICGCAISPSRLKVLPSATTCVACRGQEEMARRRDDGSPTFSMMAGEEAEADGEVM